MQIQTIFKRYELKYILTKSQKEALMKQIDLYMVPDPFGESTVRSLYFDTDNYQLIRRSIEKPVYKEKLRIRSYKQVTPDENVFIELKKKYESVVYKRRIAVPEQAAMDWMAGSKCPVNGQIADEISYFYDYYKTLHPAVLISYDRQAYYSSTDNNFRISFDQNIQSRQNRLSLTTVPGGELLMNQNQVLMEVKTAGGLPFWLVQFLTENKLYKTSFSKYGTAYQKQILTRFVPISAFEQTGNKYYEKKGRVAYA